MLYLLYLYGLTAAGMLGPDEPRYAAIGREMAASGDWITPRLWGSAWFEKPPLLYWMTAGANKAGLDADLAPRLPVALLSVWFLIFYFIRMRREFGEKAAWFAAGMLATSAGWIGFSHVGVTDIPLAVTFSASMMFALPWVRSGGRRGLVVAGCFLGLAVLAKGLVPLVLAIPLFWIGRRRWKDLLMFGLAVVVIAAPWYVLCYWLNGWPFFETLILKHHFGRFFSNELQHVRPWWYYVPVLLGFLFPWTPVLVVLRRIEWRESRQLLLAGWLVFGFIFFSASTNKLAGYILPLIPAVTALVGIHLAALPVRGLLPACTVLLCATPVVSAVLPEAIAFGLSRASVSNLAWPMVALALAVAVAVAVLERWNYTRAFAATAVTAAASLAWLLVDVAPRLDSPAFARGAWRAMENSGSPLCVDDVHRSVGYGLNYYAGHELPACSGTRDANDGNLDRDKGVSR